MQCHQGPELEGMAFDVLDCSRLEPTIEREGYNGFNGGVQHLQHMLVLLDCLMMASETLFVGDGSASIWDIASTVKMIRLQLSCQQSICFHISDELTQTLSGQFVQLHLITELHDVSVGTLSFPHTFHTHTFF